jgi:response regulator of citrate/malate metabolism
MSKEKATQEKGKRMTVEEGTSAVLRYVQENPSRADTESIVQTLGISAPTVKRYAEMLVFANKLEKHTGRTFYTVA